MNVFRTVVLQFPLSCDIIDSMRYSPQQRKSFGEAFDYLNGRDALRLVVSAGSPSLSRRVTAIPTKRYGEVFRTGIVPVSRPSSRMRRRKHRAPRSGCDDNKCAMPQGMRAGFSGMGIVLALACVSIGLGLWAISKMSSLLLGKMRRPQYYPQERSRRERLARERRRVRDRFTTAPCPEPEQLLAQYAKAQTGAREALVFGSMLCDLEAYCDNSLIRNVDGEITGRNPGMKGWIRDNCPELLPHYKNAMRYKGLAEKFRQATGAADPVPAAALAADDDVEVKRLLGGKQVCKITVRMKKTNGPRGGKTVSGTYALNAETLEAAREIAREILDECEGKDNARPRCGKKTGEVGARMDCARPKCGTEMRNDGEGMDERGKDVVRLWCGKARGGVGTGMNSDRSRCGKVRGWVARLEEILDEGLDGASDGAYAASRWRIGGAVADVNEVSRRDIASA